MKYHFETVLPPPGASFSTELNTGPVLDCLFHVHPECELTLVESGFGTRFIGSSLEPFSELDLVLIGGMVPHHYLTRAADSTGPEWSRTRTVKFLPGFCGKDLLDRPEAAALRTLFGEAGRGLHVPPEHVPGLLGPLRSLFDLEGLPKLLKLLEILDAIARLPLRSLNPAPPTEAAPPPDERLNRVLGFIHRRLDRGMPVMLAETAAVACMTPPAFSSYFRKATRRRFIEYILGLKLNRAAQLLIRTDRSVLDIAQESGFPNLSNFNRRFLVDKGVSPRDYRRRHRRSLA